MALYYFIMAIQIVTMLFIIPQTDLETMVIYSLLANFSWLQPTLLLFQTMMAGLPII